MDLLSVIYWILLEQSTTDELQTRRIKAQLQPTQDQMLGDDREGLTVLNNNKILKIIHFCMGFG